LVDANNPANVLSSQSLSLTTGASITGQNSANDSLLIDYTNGYFNLPGGISFDGGTGSFDSLAVKGDGSTSATYTPDGSTTGNGHIVVTSGVQSTDVHFIGLE